MRPTLLAAALLASLAGCAGSGVPGLPGAGGDAFSREVVENRVWIGEGADVPAGMLRAFLPDGTLVMTSCVETYRLAPWRWYDARTLVWEEDGRSLRATVAEADEDALLLLVDLGGGETLTQRFRAARAPVVCPGFSR